MLTSRRNFLRLLAAPAIVRASSLMKVVPLPELWVGEWPGVAINWGDTVEDPRDLRVKGWKEYMAYVDNGRFAESFQGGI